MDIEPSYSLGSDPRFDQLLRDAMVALRAEASDVDQNLIKSAFYCFYLRMLGEFEFSHQELRGAIRSVIDMMDAAKEE